MAHVKDLTGQKWGNITVVSFIETRGKSKHSYWKCLCACGNLFETRGSRVISGATKSCGCLATEVSRKILTKYARSSRHKGIGNPSWKGDGAKHAAIHTWLNRHYKKTKCENCKETKNLEFALKTGMNHAHNRQHYRVLCRSHHTKYDYRSGLRRNQHMPIKSLIK